ncbi:integrase core domain-containing protein [Amycolatopsis sp. MtRt-6]|uniref:integrase core domain-containing protein n=1 Tax=Amycolatopsis sp. MtRt-6 TaxID=2792782 RepID=UPI0035AC22F2
MEASIPAAWRRFPNVHDVQYASATFRAALAAVDMRPSMGRVGSRYDNAVAESFFATLKTELGTQVWATRDHARRAVSAYLGCYYNHDCLHSTLGYRTPHEIRMAYRQPYRARGINPGVRLPGGTS